MGHYLVHYANGRREEIPLIYGQNIDFWRELPTATPREVRKATLARKNFSPSPPKREGGPGRLFKFTWDNPAPDVEISHIDLVAA